MVSFVDQCVESYVSIAGIPVTKLSPKAHAPFLHESNAYMKDEPEGLLSNVALQILMKI